MANPKVRDTAVVYYMDEKDESETFTGVRFLETVGHITFRDENEDYIATFNFEAVKKIIFVFSGK